MSSNEESKQPHTTMNTLDKVILLNKIADTKIKTVVEKT